jgi:hypothetical protein
VMSRSRLSLCLNSKLDMSFAYSSDLGSSNFKQIIKEILDLKYMYTNIRSLQDH